MTPNRREFLRVGVSAAAGLKAGVPAGAKRASKNSARTSKRPGTIYNNDSTNILLSSAENTRAEEYQRAINSILDLKQGVLAQDVGQPEAAVYRTSAAAT